MVTAAVPAIITTLLGYVTSIFTTIVSVGGDLITFVTGNPICLVPLACWLVVLAIGSVRKLVKGI